MPKNLCQWLCAAAVLLVASAGWAQLASEISHDVTGGVPVIGVDVSAACPLQASKTRSGRSITPWVGWRITSSGLHHHAAVAGAFELAGPSTSDAPSFIAGRRGTRLLNDNAAEIYLGAGAYYWATSGPLDDGGGFDINGGVNYGFWRGTRSRYLRALRSGVGHSTPSDSDTKFVTTGIERATASCPSRRRRPRRRPTCRGGAASEDHCCGVNFDFDKSTSPDAVPILEKRRKR
jgi:hypothetical protein